MDDLIRRQDAVKSMTNAIWHYPNEMYAQLNSYEMAEALAKDGLMFIPSAHPEDWIERNKERILQAGMEGREIIVTIGEMEIKGLPKDVAMLIKLIDDIGR